MAIEPAEGKVYTPCDGKVNMGLDTVNYNEVQKIVSKDVTSQTELIKVK